MLLANRNNNLFDTFFNDDWFTNPWFDSRKASEAYHQMMRTDVQEDEKGYQLEMELPGYTKDEISATLEDGYMTITAEKKNESEDHKDKNYIRKERYYGKCQRTFYVGTEVEENDIHAGFQHGILTIQIPKKEPKPQVEQQRYIQIEG